MADYTDDELLQAWKNGDIAVADCPSCSPGRLRQKYRSQVDLTARFIAERDAALAEVDQLRTDNERLREFIMTEREKCSFDGPLPTGSWPDVALQLIRHLLGRRDALQAEVRQLRGALSQERDRCNQHTEDAASLAALQARIDAATDIAQHSYALLWRERGRPSPSVHMDLKAILAALGVDPQKEEQA